jgi:hypothetical protein
LVTGQPESSTDQTRTIYLAAAANTKSFPNNHFNDSQKSGVYVSSSSYYGSDSNSASSPPSPSMMSPPSVDEIDPVVFPPVTLPPVIFPDIVALSPVVCAATEPVTLDPVIDRADPRMTNIAKIVIVLMGSYESLAII